MVLTFISCKCAGLFNVSWSSKLEGYDTYNFALMIVFAGVDRLRSRSNGGSRRVDVGSKLPDPKDIVPGGQIAAQTFTFRELVAATKNFRPESFIGEGGFGRVYKGRLESTGQVNSFLLHDLPLYA